MPAGKNLYKDFVTYIVSYIVNSYFTKYRNNIDMSRTFLVLLVIVTVLSTVLGDVPQKKKCGKNEEWTDCFSLCRSPKCCQKEPEICNELCALGCECKRGYLRNRHGKCVRPCDCDC